MADGPRGVIFDVSEETVCNGVDFTFQRFVKWNDPVVAEANDGGRTAVPREGAILQAISEQTIDLLTTADVPIQGVRGDTAVYGTRTITYTLPGMLYTTPDDGDTLVGIDLEQYVRDAGDVIVDRRGWGGIFARDIAVLDSLAGIPGDYLDLAVPHQVNAVVGQVPVAQRGGTRKVQIVGRTPKPSKGRSVLQLEDAGNLAQTPPETPDPPDTAALPVPEFTLAASGTAPLTVATATVTNDDDIEAFGAGVEWQYATGDTEPTGDGTAFGPLALGFGVDTIDAPAVPSGSKVWVRARSAITATGERSDWSAWQSITLGPDDDGTGGTLAPFLLALSIDGSGVLSAEATSLIAAITKVYFVAGAAGGAAPSYAATLAGSVDASGPPFTAAALATMTEGEVRTVGAIGEDALGNRTVLVLASITRAVDTGAGAGTPGNLRITFHGHSKRVFRDVGSALAEPEGAVPMRKSENTTNIGAGRLQHANHAATGDDVELHLIYSLDAGVSFDETGVFVRADRVRFPEVGEFLPLADDAKGPNVLLSIGTKGGDGTHVIKTGNIYFDAVSSDAPPPSPPSDTDLPSGGPLGALIFEADARTLEDEGAVDGDPVTLWPDDTGITGDAAPYTTGGTQSAPTFRDDFAGGSLPCVRIAAGEEGVAFPVPTDNACTFYLVVGAITGAGSFGDGSPSCNAPILVGDGSNHSNGWVSVRADGKLQASVNPGSGGNPTKTGTADVEGASAKHIIRFAWFQGGGSFYVFIDGVLDVSVTGEALVNNSWSGIARFYLGNRTLIPDITMDVAHVACYDAAYITAGMNAVELAMQSIWGTP